jgi:ABC-type multidrug transport system ATPase subunit
LLTTQYLDEADQLADRIAVIDHGRVIAEGTPQELKDVNGAETLDEVFLKITGPGEDDAVDTNDINALAGKAAGTNLKENK